MSRPRSSRTVRRRAVTLWVVLLGAALGGCDRTKGPPWGDEAADDAGSPCDGVDDGDTCAAGMHCLGGQCRMNACGDSVRAGDEACDDGNRTAGDGCEPDCALPPEERCGNGKLESGEDCDDGNQEDGDGCSRSCVAPRCGNGLIEPENGEVCDGARIADDGSGNRLGCSADCSELIAEDACETCQNAACTDVEGVNIVDGCFRAINSEFGAAEDDPSFLQDCIDTVNCALASGCAFRGGTPGARACYCGSASIDDCTISGPASDASCVAAWQAASRSTSNADIWLRFADLSYPSAWAYYLLDCYSMQCAEQCAAAP